MEKRFWVVWNPKGYCPSVRHGSECEALAEAKRLASRQPQDQFFVLCAQLEVTAKVQLVTTAFYDQPARYVMTDHL